VDLVRARDVDVLTLQEYTADADARLAAAGLSALLPFSERQPVDGAPGSAVYSRLAPAEVGLVRGYWFYQARMVVHLGGQAVTVESVHPPPPVSESGPGWAQALREQTPASEPGLRVLAGDFNSTLDHVALRRLVNTGYRDAAATVGAGLVPTWPYYGPRSSVTPKVTIDHILVNGSIGVGAFTAVTVPNTDHRAIIATLYIGR
jgi:endonuclease/exonuclease/phosphatase family metal-dependent hydrolase